MLTTAARRLIRELPPSQQPTTRLSRDGVGALSIVELLAIVLQTPDALDLAQEVVSHFGTDRLRFASVAELQQLRGIGPVRAAQVHAALELGRRLMNHTEQRRPIKSPSQAAAFLLPQLSKREAEHLVVLLLDTKNALIETVWLYQGSLNSSVVRVAEVFREPIRRQAAAILVAHNHPSGDPEPSPEDVRVTHELVKAGQLLEIELIDHLIVGDQRYVSLKERGLGFS
jgi:DNA repair protein RadC